MSDNDYAAKIYCLLSFAEETDGDMYVRNIWDAIDTLEERERYTLECRHRYGMTQKQIGEKIGVSSSNVARILSKAIRKLRCQAARRDISVSKIINKKDEMLANKEETIEELYRQIENILQGKKPSKKLEYMLEFRKVKDISL